MIFPIDALFAKDGQVLQNMLDHDLFTIKTANLRRATSITDILDFFGRAVQPMEIEGRTIRPARQGRVGVHGGGRSSSLTILHPHPLAAPTKPPHCHSSCSSCGRRSRELSGPWSTTAAAQGKFHDRAELNRRAISRVISICDTWSTPTGTRCRFVHENIRRLQHRVAEQSIINLHNLGVIL